MDMKKIINIAVVVGKVAAVSAVVVYASNNNVPILGNSIRRLLG